jgi:hypothetical protein
VQARTIEGAIRNAVPPSRSSRASPQGADDIAAHVGKASHRGAQSDRVACSILFPLGGTGPEAQGGRAGGDEGGTRRDGPWQLNLEIYLLIRITIVVRVPLIIAARGISHVIAA